MSEKAAVVIGASSGVGRALAEKLAKEGFDLIISSRDKADLSPNAKNLELQHNVRVEVIAIDITEEALTPYVEKCFELIPNIRYVYIPAGNIHDNDNGLLNESETELLLHSNYTSVVKLTGLFAKQFEKFGEGTIAVFSSIAAAAPRSKNVIYASAKRGLETYCKGLQHYFSDSKINIQVYSLGYVDTAMSYGKKLLLPVATPEAVADFAVSKRDKNLRFSYYPKFWWFIILILKLLPWNIYKKLKF